MRSVKLIPPLLLLCISVVAIGQIKPTGLMVEFLRDPGTTRIMDLNPEFSWIVPADAGTQTAWQVNLAASREDLINGKLVWDSKKTPGDVSVEVEYPGKSLPPNSACFWRVKIWDSKGKPTEWSDIQRFITGNTDGYQTTGNRMDRKYEKPVKLVKTPDGNYFADFGKDAFGKLVLDIQPEKKQSLTIQLGEKLSGPGTIDKDPGGTIRYYKTTITIGPQAQKQTVILPVDQRNTGPAAIHLPDSAGVVVPFRYAVIENPGLELKPEQLIRETWNYYFDDSVSDFNSSDTVLNQIWDLCKYSMKATSFAGYYIDGDRERIPYEADAYINQLGHYYTDREYSLARKTNDYFMEHPTWPTEWILHTVLMFYNDLMFTGNTEALEQWYDRLIFKTLSSIAREDGLISASRATDQTLLDIGFQNNKEKIRDIVDWPPAQKDTGWKLATEEGERDGYDMREINTVVNAFYYRNLILMTEIAGLMGKNDDSIKFAGEAVKLKKSINEKLLSTKTGIYVDGEGSEHSSLHANMMALAFDLVPEANLDKVKSFIRSRGMACSVYGSQYLLEGLYRAGESDYALELMTSTDSRSWWNMIRSGSTITLEAWDMKYKPNSDWNHAWGAAPANIIPGFLWGIRPVRPGFAKAEIRPRTGNLNYSKITVPTIRGAIKAEFRKTGNSSEYIIELPGNMPCDFILPDKAGQVTFNGKKVKPDSAVLPLKPGLNRILL